MRSVALLLTALISGASAAPAPTDVFSLKRPAGGEWMGIYLLGHKAGFSYNRIEKGHLDGKPVLVATEDTTLKANVGGKTVSRRVREVKTYAWQPHGALLRLAAIHEGDGGDETLEVRFSPNGAQLTRRRPGQPTEKQTLPPSADVVENADLVRLVAATHTAMIGEIFDSQTLKDKREKVEDRGPGELVAAGVRARVEKVAVTEEDGQIAADTAIDLDDGRVLELRFGGALLAVPEPEAVAKRLDTVDLFALTRVSVDRVLPTGVVPAIVTYRIEGLPAALRPPSARQTYEDLPGGMVGLTVRASPPVTKAQRPVAGQDEFTRPTSSIQSDDPKIHALAARIVGDERDSYTAALSLSDWVFTNLHKGYGVSSDRATDVLRRKEGDCTEHSLLLTALARSVGIPARLVHGLVYAQGSDGRYGLYWHEWVEIYAGAWIAVDPTFGQAIADATHIQLGEGDQTDAVALMGQLKVSVANIEAGDLHSAPFPLPLPARAKEQPLPTDVPLLNHVAIAVKDLDQALELYQGLLGLKSEGRERVEDQGVEVAFLGSGNGRIELVTPLTAQSGVANFLQKRGEGLHHICVNVADIRATLRLLRDRGVPLIDEQPRAGAGGALIAFVHPKGGRGVLIELRQALQS